ncbi:SDR family NAD(P)-dependent oxidoreductase [Actinosynnema sp. NPDC020468]|uniref:SDR family NAD(P)-dependent oxidoreductase n=1 Tax=Actinosynnema sp. NPDC020468 TaxID=3154488 RepID=UPI0033E7DC95
MKTYVITGGTDGIGAAVARVLAARGDRVVVIGTDAAKGERLVRESAGLVSFLEADLALVADTRRVAGLILAEHPVVDGIVLCARYFRQNRAVTAEGVEDNFALFYLSRVVLVDALRAALPDGASIVNVAGPGGDAPLDWDDLQSAVDYDGLRTIIQGGRLNDVHGLTFARRNPTLRYVLFHPGPTATSMAGDFDAATAALVARQRATAKPASAVVPPVLELLDHPPARPLSAYGMDGAITLADSVEAAERLAALTEEVLTGLAPSRG